jgi:hypothetical protein
VYNALGMAPKQIKRKQLPAVVEREDDNSLGLESRQVAALQKLVELGAEPAYVDEEGKTVYSKDPQTRALQLIYEGRFGGPNRGQGRKKRAAEAMAEHIRHNFQRRMTRALGRALKADAGTKANLDAIRLAIDIERGERKLQIEEEEHDGNIGDTREELLATLFNLIGDPATAAAIEGVGVEDGDQTLIADAEVIEDYIEEDAEEAPPTLFEVEAVDPPPAGDNWSVGTPTPAPENGSDGGRAGSNGSGRAKRDRQTSPNPLTQAALRRAAERRRAMGVGET